MIERYEVPELADGIWSDRARFERWMQIQLTVMEVMEEEGLIPRGISASARAKASFDPARVLEIEQEVHHDVIAFLTELGDKIGKVESRYLHLGMTSSDMLDTALGMQLRDSAVLITKKMKELRVILADQASAHKMTVMVGRTHGIHAEPITLGMKLAVWYAEIGRHITRLKSATTGICVGKLSGAVGTYAHLSPQIEEKVCSRLGLKPAPVSTQIVQRDRHAHFLSVLAGVGASLEKFAVEIRNLQRTEIDELHEPFGKKQKGSSAMPHKRNPIICERVSGMARILRANAHAAMENVALWNERDISHSSVERVIFPDSTQLLFYMLSRMLVVIKGLDVNKKKISRNLECTNGLIYSQGVMLAMVRKGLDRLQAYRLVQNAAVNSWRTRQSFMDELLQDREVARWLDASEIRLLFSPGSYLRWIDGIYERLGLISKASAARSDG